MKRKLNDSASSSTSVRANEIIDLVFTEDELQHSFLTTPTFTHQLFNNELIPYLCNHNECRLKIYIMCNDLTQYVSFNSRFTKEEEVKVLEELKPALPDDFVTLSNDSYPTPPARLNDFNPSGKRVKKFKVGSNSYEIWLAKLNNEPEAAHLLKRAERVALWFIETADSIDASDDRWEVLFLYRVIYTGKSNTSSPGTPCSQRSSNRNQNSAVYYFAGYFTLFTFRNPFAGARLRVCQALIFPSSQGKGLGQQMLSTVYSLALAREDITEVTVEDPAPGFQKLRDKCEFELVASNHTCGSVCTAASLSQFKLTSAQADFVSEAMGFRSVYLAYANLLSGKESSEISKIIEETIEFRRFRLDVKRRLLAQNSDVKLLTKEKKQRRLEELFEIELKRYLNVCKDILPPNLDVKKK